MDFVFVIYDIRTCKVLAQFVDETECIKVYRRRYNKLNCDWIAINLKALIEDSNYIKDNHLKEKFIPF